MARKRTRTNANPDAAETASVPEPAADAAAQPDNAVNAEPPPETASEGASQELARAADPRSVITVGLRDYRGGPKMHLLRSQKFNQMQIRFDGEKPDEQYLAMLTQAGWKDRTESEGVWTKQIDRNARWQSVQKMEREFRDVANTIRKDRGLNPALTFGE